MDDAAPELLTLGQYAKVIGVSRPYLSKLKKAGKLPMVGDKVDRRAADAVRAGSADPAKQVARAPTARAIAAAGGPVPLPGATPVLPPGFETPVQRATADDRQLSADLKRLRYQRESGASVDAAGVRLAVEEHCEAAIRLADTIADRLSARVAAESDERRCHAMITSEVDDFRSAIARAASAILTSVDPTN